MVGVLKAAEKRSTFSPENKPETGRLLWAEKASLLKAAGLANPDGLEQGVDAPPIMMEAVGESAGYKRFCWNGAVLRSMIVIFFTAPPPRSLATISPSPPHV